MKTKLVLLTRDVGRDIVSMDMLGNAMFNIHFLKSKPIGRVLSIFGYDDITESNYFLDILEIEENEKHLNNGLFSSFSTKELPFKIDFESPTMYSHYSRDECILFHIGEYFTWCDKNCKGKWNIFFPPETTIRSIINWYNRILPSCEFGFSFEKKEDAVAFKMNWVWDDYDTTNKTSD